MTDLSRVESHPGSDQPALTPRFFILVLITIGLIAFIAVLAAQPGISNSAVPSAPLPAALAGQPITAHSDGAAAVNAIEELHGRGFGLTGGEVAQYGATRAWIAQARNDAGARAMIDTIALRIAEGRSPYQSAGTRHLAGHTVYALTQGGQPNFYWQSGSRVVWLAPGAGTAERELAELVTTLNGVPRP